MKLGIVFLTSFSSIIVMFLITKSMGYRQISQLSLFDYINSITLGSIGAQMAVSIDEKFMYYLIAAGTYGVFAYFFSVLTDRSYKWRKRLVGSPIILMDNQKLYKTRFKKARIDLDEFLGLLRNNGYFDLSQVDTVILEPNGQLSILPCTVHRTTTPKDFHIVLTQELPDVSLIMDGKLITEKLFYIKKDANWLNTQLNYAGITDIKQIFLAVYRFQSDSLDIYIKR